jgi:chromosome segregation ATPase
MKIDLNMWLLATFGAGLLTAGGAFLRSALANPRPTDLLTDPNVDPSTSEGDPREALVKTQAELAALWKELSTENAAREAQRIEMVEQRQRAERQVQGAQAEIQRLSAELEAEKSKRQAGDDATKELRAKLAAADEDVKKAKSSGSADPKALTAVQGEVADLQKKLKLVTEERDDARAKAVQGDDADLQKKLKAATEERDNARTKVEALERLVEGVRARSRELVDELKKLKGE